MQSNQQGLPKAPNENELGQLLGRIWSEPKDARDLIDELVLKNTSVFEFEQQPRLIHQQMRSVSYLRGDLPC